MKINKYWEGEFPSYWNKTAWTTIWKDHLVVIYKNRENKRLIEITSFSDNTITKLKTSSNMILGSFEDSIILAKVSDARSHVLISRVLSLNIYNKESNWNSVNHFLFEKYKVPKINKNNIPTFELGSYVLNLHTGVSEKNNNYNTYLTKISTGKYLRKKSGIVLCTNNGSDVAWINEDLKNFEYQGLVGDNLLFYNNRGSISLNNVENGLPNMILTLDDLKEVSGQIDGEFDSVNNTRQNTTLVDALINKDFVVWINNSNQINIYDIHNGDTRLIDYKFCDYDLCLSMICENKILVFGIENENKGSLLVINLEDNKYDTNG